MPNCERGDVFSRCRKLDRKDPEFAAWLRAYVSQHGNGWVGRNHEYWAIPVDLTLDGAHVILAADREHCYLAQCRAHESILSIGPIPNPAILE